MKILRSIFIKYPAFIFRKVKQHQQNVCGRLSAKNGKTVLTVMLIINSLLTAALLIIQKDPLGLTVSAILNSPFGGFIDLLAKVVQYFIKSVFSFEQLGVDAENINYALNHLGETIKNNSLWLLSGLQFFGVSFIVRLGKASGLKSAPIVIHSILFGVAFSGGASVLLDRLVWSEKGFGALLASGGPHGAFHFIAAAVALFAALTLLLINIYVYYMAFYEGIIIAIIPLVVMTAVLVIIYLINGTSVVELSTQYQAPIALIGLPIITASYIFFHKKHPDLLELSPEEAIDSIDGFFNGEENRSN